MAQPTWNPNQYLKFAGARVRPALDLLGRVDLDGPSLIYDLGCGPGHVTRALAERWPEARVIGVDHSAEMLAHAADAYPEGEWIRGDIADWQPAAPADLIYANAALHWLDDHPTLLPRLLEGLAPGGALAVQMPRNHPEPSHTGIADTVADGPWTARLAPLLRPFPVHEPPIYYDILAPHAARLELWETTYVQPMQGADPIAEWTRGSALKPFLDALDGAERDRFYAAYAARMRAAYPRRADGTTLFPFRRLFFVARR